MGCVMMKGEDELTRVEGEICMGVGDSADSGVSVRRRICKRCGLCGEEGVCGDFIRHLTIVDEKFCAGGHSSVEGGYDYMGRGWWGQGFIVNGDLMR